MAKVSEKFKKFINFQLYKLSKKEVFCQSRVCYGIGERAFLNPVTRWHCKGLPYPKQVDVSYKRLCWLQMLVQQIERLLLQPFRVATVTTMVISTTLVTTVIGGLLLRTMQQMHGTVT